MASLGRLVILLMTTLMLFSPAAEVVAQATPVVDHGIYRDPEGRFTVPIPTNWTVEEADDIATLRDPDGDLSVYLLVVKASSATDAVPLALQEVEAPIGPDAIPLSTQDVPSVPGVDETTVVTFLSDDNSSAVQVVGQRVDETVYCLIFAGSLNAAAKRSAQLQVIASGFTITSLSAVDLSGKPRAGLTKSLLADFEAYAQELLTRLEVPGASVAIVANGKVVYAKGFGVKEIGGADPVTGDTQMMIGSATKSMTTMMMATEVDDGLMTWDEPVVDILPEFAVADPKLTKRITVRNLVCACTGVPRRDLEFIFNAHDLTAEDVIASLKGFEFFTGFGEAFQYSNQMVATGGYVAAAAAGGGYGGLYDAYVKQMQARVFGPIGLTRTTLSFAAVGRDPDHATPHGATIDAKYEPIPLSLEEMLVPVAPAGLVWSSANDMARYLITELQHGVGPDGNRVVSRKNLEETWVPQVAVSATVDYGLGWLVEDYHGIRLIHHGGNTLGFTSELAFLPDKGVGIVVLANGQAANAYTEGVRARLLELLFDQPEENDKLIDYTVEQSDSAYQSMTSQIVDVPADVAASAIGTYESDVLGPVVLSMQGDELIFDAGEFSTRLKLAAGSDMDGEVTLIAADPPLAGTPFTIRHPGTGRQELVLDTGTDTYVFKLKRGHATPTVDDGTPIAA